MALTVIALLPLAGCLPDNPYWAPNQPVHPQFVSAPLPDDWLLRQASCIVGMTWDNYVLIDAWINIGDGDGNLERWYSYVLTEFPTRVASTADCWQAWFGKTGLRWWCGGDLHPYPPAPNWNPNDTNLMRGFRLNTYCTGPDSFAFYPVSDWI